MNAALAVAMLRHQDRLARSRVGAERGDGLGRLAGAAAASRAGPLVGESGRLARRRPQSLGRAPDRELREAPFRTSKPLHLIFASLATKDPPACSSRSKACAARVHTVPIPDHSCFAPDDLAEIAGNLGFAAEAHDDVEQALAAVAGRRARADLRLALPCRRGPRRQRADSRLGFRALRRPSGAVAPSLARRSCAAHPPPFEQHEHDREQRRPPRSSGTPTA